MHLTDLTDHQLVDFWQRRQRKSPHVLDLVLRGLENMRFGKSEARRALAVVEERRIATARRWTRRRSCALPSRLSRRRRRGCHAIDAWRWPEPAHAHAHEDVHDHED